MSDTTKMEPPVISVFDMIFPDIIAMLGEEETRVEKTEERRASFVFYSEDAKVNNAQHALRGNCGNTG